LKDNTIAQKIRKARQKKGITQTDLALAINKTLRMVQKYEHGSVIPSIPLLIKISQFLEIPTDDLLQAKKLPNFSSSLEYSRNYSELSISEVAKKLNITEKEYLEFEEGSSYPTFKLLDKMGFIFPHGDAYGALCLDWSPNMPNKSINRFFQKMIQEKITSWKELSEKTGFTAKYLKQALSDKAPAPYYLYGQILYVLGIDYDKYEDLNNSEFDLLSDFNKLTTEGQAEATKRISELSQIPKYCDEKEAQKVEYLKEFRELLEFRTKEKDKKASIPIQLPKMPK